MMCLSTHDASKHRKKKNQHVSVGAQLKLLSSLLGGLVSEGFFAVR